MRVHGEIQPSSKAGNASKQEQDSIVPPAKICHASRDESSPEKSFRSICHALRDECFHFAGEIGGALRSAQVLAGSIGTSVIKRKGGPAYIADYEYALGSRRFVGSGGINAKSYTLQWIEYHLWDNCFAITTMMGDEVKPSEDGGKIALEVTDVDSFVETLRKKGTRIKLEPVSTPICRMAVLLDPEGNAPPTHKRSSS